MAFLANIAARLKPFGAWLKTAWSEPDGSGSSTRIHISLLIAFILGVGTSFGVLVHKHSITIEQFDQFLVASGTFLTTSGGILYGTNKLADIFKGKGPDNK